MKAWAEILRAKECTALISGILFFFNYLFIYLYTIQIYTVHQFPPQVLIWIAHFTAFPMLSLQVPPALTPNSRTWNKISLYEATISALVPMFAPVSHGFPCIFPLFLDHVVHHFVLFKREKKLRWALELVNYVN